jgi:3-hydroxyisobutyrate dehydrogenase-like beta-hydroxyacid dehydrogenase
MSRKSRKNVGLIGLGIIGSRAVAGLRAAGFQVFVWNRSPKAAPNFLGSAAEVAQNCEVIQIFVSDAPALFEVIEAMRDALTPEHVVVCSATVGPEATLEAARLVEERGAKFLDAPFTGSKLAAEKRQLVYYVGGDDTTFLRVKPVLEAMSRAIVRIGAIGHAATIKVVTNMIAAVSIQTLAEALAIVQKAGIDPEILGAALEQNAARSGTMDLKLPMMIAGDYEPHFSLKHMFKDVQLGIHMATALDLEVPATTVTAGVMYGALNQGWGDLDFSSLYKVYETRTAAPKPALPSAVPPPRAEPKPHRPEPIVLEPLHKPGECASPKPASEEDPDALTHPYNFVKRWFVSRPGH